MISSVSRRRAAGSRCPDLSESAIATMRGSAPDRRSAWPLIWMFAFSSVSRKATKRSCRETVRDCSASSAIVCNGCADLIRQSSRLAMHSVTLCSSASR